MVDINSKMFHDKFIGELVLKIFLWRCKLNIPIFSLLAHARARCSVYEPIVAV